jgi:ligand-binding SRPBCC domain-containing protein
MTVINLTTPIDGDIEVCFDLARDIDIHQLSTIKSNERAIGGRMTGLCELGDTITWEARHFGVTQQLTVEITKFNRPYFFEDRMVKGAFKSMRHEHHFEGTGTTTVMTDKFVYEVPFGIFGRIFDSLILKKYLSRFLRERNQVLKELAEKNV